MFLEAVVHHYLQQGESWHVRWLYLILLVKEIFRAYGYGTNLSPLDIDVAEALRSLAEHQMASTTRMRTLVKKHFDEALWSMASAKVAELS
mmetsp:Transcript_28926/g.71420  ORF Transcript_28926/g.71420 Transcript_28926/m.71420 type:complete len:91 (-) Transcript_28926:71-343(-)